MDLREMIQVYKAEEALEDLIYSAVGNYMEDEEHDGAVYDVVPPLIHKGIDAQLEFLTKDLSWTESQIRAQLFDEELSLDEETK